MLIKNRDNPVTVCWLTVFTQSQTVKGNSVVMFFLFLFYVFIVTNCVSIKRKLHCQHQATYRHQVTNPMTVCSRTTVRSNGNRSAAFPGAFFSQLYVKRLHMDSGAIRSLSQTYRSRGQHGGRPIPKDLRSLSLQTSTAPSAQYQFVGKTFKLNGSAHSSLIWLL